MTLSALLLAAAIDNVAELRQSVWNADRSDATFAVTCSVTAVAKASHDLSCWVVDETGCGYLRTTNSVPLQAGGRYFLQGHVGADKFGWLRAFIDSAAPLGAGRVPAPVAATPEQLSDETFDGRPVVMRGTVVDIVHDEIDPAWRFLLMRTATAPFFAAVSVGRDASLDHLLGATISAKGIATVLPDGAKRKFQTPQLTVTDTADITIDIPADDDPRHAPPIPDSPQPGVENIRYRSVAALSRMGRRRVEGCVIAAFNEGREVLVRTDGDQIVGLALAEGEKSPSWGERVIAAGFPETDLFIIILTKARLAPAHGTALATGPAVTLSEDFDMATVLRDICAKGLAVRLRGRVVDVDEGVFAVALGGRLVRVDASALAPSPGAVGIVRGCEVSVAGTCVRNTSRTSHWSAFPHTEGFTVAPRVATDLQILRCPPWWTTGRLLTLIIALGLALLGAAVWNRELRRLAERRGRQLLKAEIGKVASELRVDERTRLAAEIHDAVSQTITGVSFQIDAVERTFSTDRDAAAKFLAIARRALQSCREDLRRCLWDLRSNTLAEADFADAVRRTVRPWSDDAKVTVRFAVPRAKLSDSTAHAVLSIVRELVVNAVRHGRARHVWIAGEHREGRIRFSVRDDGCGFDPATCPGPKEGHFGLQGVKERAIRVGGSVKIESAADTGTKITVEMGR